MHMAHKARRLPPKPKRAVFNADHSFVFTLIKSVNNNNNADILFTGRFEGAL